MTAWARRLAADPLAATCAVSGLMVFVAFAAFLGAWKGASGTARVDAQIAYLASGGLGGLGLLVTGVALFTVQTGRWLAAREFDEVETLVSEARSAVDDRAADESARPAPDR